MKKHLSKQEKLILCSLTQYDGLSSSDLVTMTNTPIKKLADPLNNLMIQEYLQKEKHGAHHYFVINYQRIHELELDFSQLTPLLKQRNNIYKIPRDVRVCYSHIAGQLGVALRIQFEEQGLITLTSDKHYQLTQHGGKKLFELGLTPTAEEETHSRFCLDSTERRYHLGGKLGKQLLKAFQLGSWITRKISSSRSLEVTDKGKSILNKNFGLTL